MYSAEEPNQNSVNSKNHINKWVFNQTNIIMQNEQVDWAALAQQWIQMKESCATPVPPPPPNISLKSLEEKGEAPMEVVKDEDFIIGNITTNQTNTILPPGADWQNNCFTGPTQWRQGWTNWTNAIPTPVLPQSLKSPTVQKEEKIFYRNGKFTNNTIPLEGITMDAAKRKTLPAWIREGLEKMEKEKKKQIENVKPNDDIEQNKINLTSVSPASLAKDILNEKIENLLQEEASSSDENDGEHKSFENNLIKNSVDKSSEEVLKEWMLVVRRVLTEILLEVTDEEISNISQETLKKFKLKASSAQVIRKSAITSLTSTLGLGAYEDSNSENDSDDEQEEKEDSDSEEDIKNIIKKRQQSFKVIANEIELASSESEKIEQHKTVQKSIDAIDTNKKTVDKNFGETHPDKKNSLNGKRSRERTSRFSDISDLKSRTSTYVVKPTTLASSSNDNAKFSHPKSRRYSDSSSSSNDSYNKNKKSEIFRKHTKYHSKSKRQRSRSSSNSDDYSKHRKHSYSRERTRSRSRSSSKSYSRKYGERKY